jgi:Arc/MetJ-type ribon-helix-helix transcriptional regulator
LKGEKFDPRKMQEIIDKLRAEGRLPSAEEFVRTAMEIRERYREKILNATERKRKGKVRRSRPN